jgi:hypothetical protein
MIELNNYFPQDIINYIFEFVDNVDKVFINKNLYKKYHYLLRYKINSFRYEKYIRFTIRQNMYLPFEHIINENYKRWIRMKKYTYKDMQFSNYIEFLKFYCNENNSQECFDMLMKFLNAKNRKFIQAISIYSNVHGYDNSIIYDINNVHDKSETNSKEINAQKYKINRNIIYKKYYKL